MKKTVTVLVWIALVVTLGFATSVQAAEESSEELARQAQNPVAKLISVPFQDNVNFNVGPLDKTQNVLNIQPVIPISLNERWNIITRTIVPVISQPALSATQDRIDGIGPIQATAFLSPDSKTGLIWGVGPIIQLPTATNDRLGSNNWGMGPSAVALRMDGNWVYGALMNNVFSIGGSDPCYSTFLLQPFVNYNFPGGFYLTTAPIITADWKASGGDVWTVPLGGGAGKIWKIGKLPVNTQIQAFGNAHHPSMGANWSLRLQVQLMFPK